ncbi:Cytochrome P450 82A3 [Bienertia sinuspersici]
MELFTLCVLLSIVIVLGSACYSMRTSYNHPTKKKLAPKAGGGWPIIGHLPLLRFSNQLPHVVLATMANTYGAIFRINLGVNQVLVISSSELAKECLKTNDKALLGRGKLIGFELMGYNYAQFGFSPYGPYWRHMRKIVTHELLSNYRCDLLSNVFASEIRSCVRKVYGQWTSKNTNVSSDDNMVPVLVDLTKVLKELTLNLIARIISGKQLVIDKKIDQAIRVLFERLGVFNIGDALPFMRWFDLGGQEKAMKKCFTEIDNILQGWLEDHKQSRSNNNMQNDVDHDFMDIMLSAIVNDNQAFNDVNYDADTIVKATCLGMLIGGTDSNQVALTWAFSLLLKNPEALKKAKEELNIQIGKEKQVSILDIPKLVYLQAIVKETLRLYPPTPLINQREFTEDCTIGNYHVKSGTKLIVNVSKISRDPQVWDNPLEFHPERFLESEKNVDVKGHHFELLPFGAGRRMCPGISFGLQVVHLSLATLLHAFDFSTPDSAPVDLTESFGLTSMKTNPLLVLLAPTLSYGAYAS